MRFNYKVEDLLDKVKIIIFFFICGLSTLAFTYEWNIELIDGSGSDYNSLDIDNLGRPHIAYFTGLDLRYAYKDTSNWHIQNVAESCGQYLSLKLSQTGKPKISHISYISGLSTGKLIYSYIQNDTWCHIKVDTLLCCAYSSLALGSNGEPHISYVKGSWFPNDTLKVKYAHHNDTTWEIQRVDSLPTDTGWISEFKSTSIVLDRFDRAQIAYGLYEREYYGIQSCYVSARYACQTDSSWNIDEIYFLGSWWVHMDFEKISLSLDQDETPHVAFSFENTFPFFSKTICYSSGPDWYYTQYLIDSSPQLPALDMDSLNRAHIAYLSENRLMYAIWDGINWTFDTILTGNISGDVSLKLDQDDNPHICYFSNGLYYAYGSPTGIEETMNLNAISSTLEIYPNPAKSFFTVRLPQVADRTELKIFDVSGKLVVSNVSKAHSQKQEVRISLKGINPGIYFLRVGKETKKFLVVK